MWVRLDNKARVDAPTMPMRGRGIGRLTVLAKAEKALP